MKEQHSFHRGIEDILEGYWMAYENRDIDEILSYHPKDRDIMLIGTGKDEVYTSLEEYRKGLERDFAQSEKVELELENYTADSSGKVAWVSLNLNATVTIEGKEHKLIPRYTAVLEFIDGKWYIMQSHLSFPSEEQKEGESFPVK